MTSIFPHLSLADPINDKVALLVQNYGDAFHSFSLVVLKYLLVPLERTSLCEVPIALQFQFPLA